MLKDGIIEPKPDFEPPEATAEGPKMGYKDFRAFLDGAGGAKLSEHDRLTLIECLDPAGTGMGWFRFSCASYLQSIANLCGSKVWAYEMCAADQDL